MLQVRVNKQENSTQNVSRIDNERWGAVIRRERTADARFVYAVRTTGIYCRPTCPARLALRKNVRFFDTFAEAERAGFRACHRCKPNGVSPAENDFRLVRLACRMIEAAEEAVPGTALAEAAGLSRFHFQRMFKRVAGVTPRQYGIALRNERARKSLRKAGTVTEAIYSAGFNASSRFYEHSNAMLGMRPKDYRARGKGLAIEYAVVKSALGPVLVAGTSRGICAVHFGESRAQLEKYLQNTFSSAEICVAGKDFQLLVEAVVKEIAGEESARQVPLDLRGTVFQHRVWEALRQLPAGETITYTALAERLGKPSAVRAVAGACAANPVAVVVPCHRVVRSDGTLAGYRWGLARKEKLLKREAQKKRGL